ncbi:MAG: hypothetical protein EOP85_23375 [Verrucomicrobiaceae bacterium]|nr:MAG: hypothetical protein EOP85_23375 [Verrucomicrobiaceae bacterium]
MRHGLFRSQPPAAMKDTVLDSPPATERPAEYAIYKPNSRGTGGVIRFGLNKAKASLFVDAANQSGDKHFDWENKITMKWGFSDIGGALAVLQGRMPQAKLFHQSERANSAFELTRQDNPERAPYLLSISRQDSADRTLRKITLPLSHADAAVLETALRTAVTRLLGW